MQYGYVAGIAKPISRLVQGTVMIGSKVREKSFALMDAVFESGGTAFDTAHQYGDGDCERVLGSWLGERGLREKIVVITKGAHHNQDRKRVTPFDITSDLHDSLARLKSDYIDLYLLHRDDPAVPVGPIIEILNEHLRAGRIHAFGGSNWSHARIREANEYAREHRLTPFAVSSPNFSLAEQVNQPWADTVSISGAAGEAARAWYAQQNMPLVTWSSLAGGFFSGRFSRENRDAFDGGMDKIAMHAYGYEQNFQRLDRVKLLAEKKGLTIPQIALAFVLNQPLNIFAVVGSLTGAEFRANVEASEIKLSQEEMAWLDLKSEANPF